MKKLKPSRKLEERQHELFKKNEQTPGQWTTNGFVDETSAQQGELEEITVCVSHFAHETQNHRYSTVENPNRKVSVQFFEEH